MPSYQSQEIKVISPLALPIDFILPSVWSVNLISPLSLQFPDTLSLKPSLILQAKC